MTNSYELLLALVGVVDIDITYRDRYWWYRSGEFEVVIGAILTQQTKWQNVEKSLENLNSIGALEFNKFLTLDIGTIKEAIKPSGFYNQKSQRLYELVKNIDRDFGSLDEFKTSVSREWLLGQKGIGFESADSILCYFAYQEVMVVDSYTKRLMQYFDYEFENYDDMVEWFEAGVNENYDKICKLFDEQKTLHEIYALYHGYIVEFCKSGCKNIDKLGLK
jgi:endonuclease-3 related protein